MTITDLTTIIGNFSQSLYPIQRLITGAAYILGFLFLITAIEKFKKIGDKRSQSSSQEKMYTPMMYLVIGAILIYLPSAMSIMANTAFGVGNVISYTTYNPYDIYSTMGVIIRTGGVLWFIRGCVLVAHASEPGTKDGTKGLLFILAGIIAMNFDNTISVINYTLNTLISWTMKFKSTTGF